MTQNETKFMDSAMALAETLHFTKAAKLLRISQPQLTKNIQDLEDLLGFHLFDRDRKKVELNDAGRAYLEKSKLAIMYADRAVQAERDIVRETESILYVGRFPYTDPYLVSILQSIQLPLHPSLRVELSSRYSYDLIDDVLDGTLDLALATQPTESPLLTMVQVSEAPFYIAISAHDKLARYPLVTLDCLSKHCWILFERRLHPPLYDHIIHLSRERNAVPKNIRHITAPEEAFPLVEQGECAAFVVKAGALLLARNGVTVRPLVESELILKTYLVSRADDDSKLLGEFVRTFMRRLSPPKKGVQSAMPAGLKRLA